MSDFQKLKTQMQEIQKILTRPIEDDNKSRAGLEMQKNQAANNLEQLKILEKSMLKNYSNLYLVVSAEDKLMKAFEEQDCFVGDHMFLAKKVANHFWPQFQPGMGLNSFIVDQINQFMDTICQQIGLNTWIRPRLKMEVKYQNALQSEAELATLLEAMFEDQLKNEVLDTEGHVLQALMSTQELMKKYGTVDKVGRNVNFVVSVPALSDNVIDAYKNLLSANVYTVKTKLDLTDSKKLQETVKSVLKKKEEV